MNLKSKSVNNDFYDDLNDSWWDGQNHPIALLRAENKIRNPWIQNTLKKHFDRKLNILDIGCGGGLLTTFLAENGHQVTGIDTSKHSLETAKKQDRNGKINYIEGCALTLPFKDQEFDCVCAMDLLEHIPCYETAVKEAARVLKNDGLFFFHTFNRNIFSFIMIIKGVEWFVKNTPPDMHVYDKFIKPKELLNTFKTCDLELLSLQGLVPDFKSRSFLKMLTTRCVDNDFRFKFVKNTLTGYVGVAIKKS
jgi:2-polyprenyl-6-hydroxyphenyl methylase / 3-demethylubiquinone-9 3-methyltransferase